MWRICNLNTLFKHLRIYITLGPYFVCENVFIRSFIYSEINIFGQFKFSNISFAFDIFVPTPVQEIVCLKAIQNINPMNVSVSGTSDKKRIWKTFVVASAPLVPPWIRLWLITVLCKRYCNIENDRILFLSNLIIFTVARLFGEEAFNGSAFTLFVFAANCTSFAVSSFSLADLDELALFVEPKPNIK